jgi:hypothetical protein
MMIVYGQGEYGMVLLHTVHTNYLAFIYCEQAIKSAESPSTIGGGGEMAEGCVGAKPRLQAWSTGH